jgi:preprotein translocase subunit SecF
MFVKPRFRLVPDGTRIHFMRGRYMGLIVSAILSTASVIMFFYPGLNLGIDFSGGVVMEVHTPGPANFAQIHAALAADHIPDQGVQRFGDASEVLIRLGAQSSEQGTQAAAAKVKAALEKGVPGATIERTDVVGASVSAELFRNGLLALGISLLMILVYIWFRFEWQFAVGAVVTLVLDITKAIGFIALTRLDFDLVMVAAILTVLGYSTNDKVVVYDRVRENLRKYKSMPLRELIDLSINETLNRTLGTSMTVFLASLPLALFGGESISGFAWVMLFGIVVGPANDVLDGVRRIGRGGDESHRLMFDLADHLDALAQRRIAAIDDAGRQGGRDHPADRGPVGCGGTERDQHRAAGIARQIARTDVDFRQMRRQEGQEVARRLVGHRPF